MTFSTATTNLHKNALAVRGETPPHVLRKYYGLYPPSGAPCTCACHAAPCKVHDPRASHSDRKNIRDFDSLTLGLFSEHLQMHVASGSASRTPLGDTTLEARMTMAAESPGRYPLHDAFFARLAEDGVALDGWIMMDELKLRTSSYMLEFYDTEAPAGGWEEDGWEEALNLGEGTAHLKKIVAIMKKEEGSNFDADDGA